MARTYSKEKRRKGGVINDSLITVFYSDGWYLVCGPCSNTSGKEVHINSNQAFVPRHWVSHCQPKTHILAKSRIKAWKKSKSEAGTSTSKKNQRTILVAGSTSVPSIFKIMKKVSKEKRSTTDKPYIFPHKRYDFVLCSIVMYLLICPWCREIDASIQIFCIAYTTVYILTFHTMFQYKDSKVALVS